jgi:hypothetical protein
MSTYGLPGSLTYSVSYPSLDAMMAAIKDNTSGAIRAAELRNSVLTLWDLVYGNSASSVTYTSNTASTISVGGIPVGTNFSNTTIQQIFDQMFLPYVAPIIDFFGLSTTLSGSYSNIFYLENGSTLFNSLYIKWNINQGSINLVSNPGLPNNIYLTSTDANLRYNGFALPEYINSIATQSGVITVGSASNGTSVINLEVYDGINTISSTCSVNFLNRFYWGNFVDNPATYTLTNSDIQNLNGASVSLIGIDEDLGTGNILTNTRVQTLNGINGSGNYLVFAFPSSFGNPIFIANGMVTTAFGVTNSVFTNTYGRTQSYNIWYSNTIQNSPITYFQIN